MRSVVAIPPFEPVQQVPSLTEYSIHDTHGHEHDHATVLQEVVVDRADHGGDGDEDDSDGVGEEEEV
jgi:hypothetical protein